MNTENLDLEDTKDRIAQVALELFATFGFDGVSTRKIAEVAKCNIASLNYHFGTKRQLYNECLILMEPKENFGFEEILTRATDKNDFDKKMERFCIHFLSYVLANASSLKLLINEINADTKEGVKDSFIKPILNLFEGFLRDSQQDKIVNKNIEAGLYSRMLISVLLSQKLYKSLRAFEETNDEELAKKLVRSSTCNFFE